MKKLLLSLFLLLTICQLSAQVNKVLVIGIDGCRPDAMAVASTPNIDALVSNATYSMDALNDRITVSGPGWSSMLTGTWPAKHGVTNNAFTGSDYATYPHFMQRVEDHDPTLHTVSISQWHPINDQIAVSAADTVINVADNTIAVRDAAVSYLTLFDPDVMFVHFDDVDHAGHGSGFSPTNPVYTTSIETVDAGIGGIVTAITSRPTYATENWAIIVSTDHGGLGTSHGGNSPEEEIIFLIVSGDSIPNAEVTKDSTLTTVPPVFNCLGDSVELYFDGSDGVTTNLNPAYNFGTTQDFSVECRVRTTSPGDVAIVTDKDWDSGIFKGWVFSFVIGSSEWKVNVGDGSNRVDLEGNLIDDGEWHTLSATFDRSDMLRIYEDGVPVDSGSIAGIGDIYTGDPISFGEDADGGYRYTGHIAEVRVFDNLLSESTIDTWKCTPITAGHPNNANLIGYWRLNEGGGAGTVIDSSPTGEDGTIAGATWEVADDTNMVWIYDYSGTPRQVDVAVSALEHMCIPIDPAWGLDGNIFGTDCNEIITGIETDLEEGSVLSVYPNPSKGLVSFASAKPGRLRVLDVLGNEILLIEMGDSDLYEMNSLAAGSYFYQYFIPNQSPQTGVFMVTE